MIRNEQYIKSLFQLPPGAKTTAHGWVKTRRDSKGVHFIQINDGSCFADLQIVMDAGVAPAEEIAKVSTGACIQVSGTIVESPGKGQAVELRGEVLEVLGAAAPETYALQKKKHNLQTLRELGHFRPRSNTFGAVFRVRNALSFAIHKFFQERGFLYVHAPILTTSDAEGAGAMFQVTTLDLMNLPRGPQGVDFSQDFFGRPAFLTVSGQLEAEIFALAFTNVYTFGPTFRAENSNTPRHLAEFWMIEPEMAFCDLEGNQDLAEEFLQYLIAYVMHNCRQDLEFFNQRYDPNLLATLENVVSNKFARVPYTDAVQILEKSGKQWEFPVHWGADLQSEHERFLTEETFRKPVIVTDYPREIKAFYMRENEGGKTVRAMDVLAPGIGEIIGGSQREERLDVLVGKIRAQGLDESHYWWYLDLRRYGSVPHAGFGLGFERMMMYVTGMKNIRDVIPFPRTPGHAEF
ncbi:MAG TPA: asparagine--tRNA ligase [Bryobacteraceae bacterium]|nr:asparagine--tRNA ligase [Bryobacteraceae bacterium]